jgi:hypothetical protein
MPVPITRAQSQAQPDVLGSFRYDIFIPTMPMGNIPHPSSMEGLRISNVELQLPTRTVAMVKVPFFGFTRSFAGGADHTNELTASFYENVKGDSTGALLGWQDHVKSFNANNGPVQAGYSTTVIVICWDTAGNKALEFTFFNVWPSDVTPPAGSREQSQAGVTNVKFSFDYFELTAIGGYAAGSPRQAFPTPRRLPAIMAIPPTALTASTVRSGF